VDRGSLCPRQPRRMPRPSVFRGPIVCRCHGLSWFRRWPEGPLVDITPCDAPARRTASDHSDRTAIQSDCATGPRPELTVRITRAFHPLVHRAHALTGLLTETAPMCRPWACMSSAGVASGRWQHDASAGARTLGGARPRHHDSTAAAVLRGCRLGPEDQAGGEP